MGQFDNNIKIQVDLNDIESIRSCLRKYQGLLRTDEAVEDRVFQVEFVKLVGGQMKAL